MAAFNAERFLAVSVESVLRQTYEDWELVLLDDGSTDATAEIARSYADRRIRYFANARNMGLVYTRNRLLSLARGAYVAVLDSDDVSYPDRLEREVDFLDQHPEHGIVGGAIDMIDSEGRPMEERWRPASDDLDIRVGLFFGNQFAHSTVMMRKSVLPEPAYRNGYAPAEDYDLWIRTGQVSRLHNLETPLVAYRKHGNNISFSANSGLAQAEQRIVRDNVLRMTGMQISAEDASLLHQLFRRTGTSLLSGADADRLSTLLAAFARRFPGTWGHMDRARFVRMLLEHVLELQKCRARGPAAAFLAALCAPVGSRFERASFVSDAVVTGVRRRLPGHS